MNVQDAGALLAIGFSATVAIIMGRIWLPLGLVSLASAIPLWYLLFSVTWGGRA